MHTPTDPYHDASHQPRPERHRPRWGLAVAAALLAATTAYVAADPWVPWYFIVPIGAVLLLPLLFALVAAVLFLPLSLFFAFFSGDGIEFSDSVFDFSEYFFPSYYKKLDEWFPDGAGYLAAGLLLGAGLFVGVRGHFQGKKIEATKTTLAHLEQQLNQIITTDGVLPNPSDDGYLVLEPLPSDAAAATATKQTTEPTANVARDGFGRPLLYRVIPKPPTPKPEKGLTKRLLKKWLKPPPSPPAPAYELISQGVDPADDDDDIRVTGFWPDAEPVD